MRTFVLRTTTLPIMEGCFTLLLKKDKGLTLVDVLEGNTIGSVIATHTECFLHVEGSK